MCICNDGPSLLHYFSFRRNEVEPPSLSVSIDTAVEESLQLLSN
jgi:hypothetical protein